MAFHEGFWILAGTTAPVIALAAVVSVGESITIGGDIDDRFNEAREMVEVTTSRSMELALMWRYNRRILHVWICILGLLLIVILQAALLALSLLCVESQRNLLAPWAAVVAAVSGLVVLAVAVFANSVLKGQDKRLLGDIKFGLIRGTDDE